MNIPDGLKKVAEWATLLLLFAGVAGTFGRMWIDGEVERRMNELTVEPLDPASAPIVVELNTKVDGLQVQAARIEGKVDAFSTSFQGYLERQAGD